MKILYIDTETTGIDPRTNDILEFAGIVEIDGMVQEEFDIYMQPIDYTTISKSALEVTGFTLAAIRDSLEPEQAYRKILKILDKYINKYDKTDKFAIAGYNVKFDVDMWSALWQVLGDKYLGSYITWCGFDALSEASKLKARGKLPVANLKLGTVAEHYGLTAKYHNALEDTRVTRALLYKMGVLG